MKHRPRQYHGIFQGKNKIPISKSIARKTGLALGVDTNTVIDAHNNRAQLSAIIAKLEPDQVLDLLIEIDLILQQSENTAQRSVEATRATNEKLNIALHENQKVLEQLSKLVHGNEPSLIEEPIEQLIPAVNSLVNELQEQNKQLKIARKEAESAGQSKMNFLANMSHEIRTPMNGIFGMVNLVLNTQLNTEQKDYIETIHSSTESLLTILNDVLEYSKLSTSSVTLEYREFNVRNLVMDIVRTFKATATHKNINFNSIVSPDIPTILVGDDHRIRQVLSNLVGNAIKFTQQGEVRLKVNYILNRGVGSIVRFSVIDTGIGMEAGTIDKLFQPFTQADASITRDYGGTGLGLSICNDLADAMDGKITVKSELGKGTKFDFELSLEEPESTNEIKYSSPSAPTISELADGQQFPHIPILIVEDNLINQKVTSLIIKKLGYPVTIASNGEEAVDLCADNNYKIILMDLSMPKMDGFEATQRIRSNEKDGVRSTIIAVSGHAFIEHRERCEEVGVDGFLTKPYDLFKLKEKLDHYGEGFIS